MFKLKSKAAAIVLMLLFVCAGAANGQTWQVRSYVEDNTHVSGARGVLMLAVRNDTLATLADTDGDLAVLQVNAAGALYTDDVSGAAMLVDLAAIEVLLAKGTGAMAASHSVTLATDDTSFGTVGDAAASAGNVHAQLRYIAEATFATQTATEAIQDELDGTTHEGKTLTLAKIDVDLAGGADSAAIIAASGSEVIYIVEWLITVDAQCQLQFTDGSETASTAGIEFCQPAYGGVHLKRDPGYRFALDASEMMSLDDIDGGTVEVRGYVWYYQE